MQKRMDKYKEGISRQEAGRLWDQLIDKWIKKSNSGNRCDEYRIENVRRKLSRWATAYFDEEFTMDYYSTQLVQFIQ